MIQEQYMDILLAIALTQKGIRFYCLTHSTRIVESNKAICCKDKLDSKSDISCVITFRKESVVIALNDLSILRMS